MRTRPLTMWGCLLAASLFGSAPAAEAPPPGFTRKPTAARAGDKVKIEFAADRETDAAVFIEDAKGKVVRHLVAGALGTNPPAPLKPGLSQSIEWDGKADRFVAGFIGSPAMNFLEATLVREEDACFVDAAGFKLKLPEAFYPRVEPYAGRAVVFGVRPEDMAEHDPAAGDVHGNTLTARADVVETLGSETFVYLTCGPHAIVARMEVPERPLTVGQTLEVDLKMAKTHIFDRETSLTIV